MRAGWMNIVIGLLNSEQPRLAMDRRVTWVLVIAGCLAFWALLLQWAL